MLKKLDPILLLAIWLLSYTVCSGESTGKNVDDSSETIQNNLDSTAETDDRKSAETFMLNLVSIPKGTYQEAKSRAVKSRDSLKAAYLKACSDSQRQAVIDSAGAVLTRHLLHGLIPFWYGTVWSFEGHTSTPNEGEIACGYFVSTVLRDAGFNLNRYKLAQKSAKAEAMSLSVSEKVNVLKNSHDKCVQDYFKDKKEGLYFVGLDFHVGFILNSDNKQYFIHSNYIDYAGVMVENAEESEAFGSESYHLTRITNNRSLIKSWIMNKRIRIVSDIP